jgi:succinate dehydrogenase / fumarate reductase iron-sulfur subunit
VSAPETTFRVRRYDPAAEPQPRWVEYRVLCPPGFTVLDGLRRIKETQDASLSWRSSCRMGICGSCGMFINGRPRLACNTQVAELGTAVIEVAPLPSFDTLRDLVPDLQPMFEAHARVRPFILRDDVQEREHPTAEYRQTPEEMERYLQFSYCIKCGCCMAACPTCATDPAYLGPMPLSQAHRYDADSRDGGFAERAGVLDAHGGPWSCHYAGECSRSCPKGVDPARAIQLLRRELVLDLLRLRRRPKPAPVLEAPREAKRRSDVPEAPKPTVTAGA